METMATERDELEEAPVLPDWQKAKHLPKEEQQARARETAYMAAERRQERAENTRKARGSRGRNCMAVAPQELQVEGRPTVRCRMSFKHLLRAQEDGTPEDHRYWHQFRPGWEKRWRTTSEEVEAVRAEIGAAHADPGTSSENPLLQVEQNEKLTSRLLNDGFLQVQAAQGLTSPRWDLLLKKLERSPHPASICRELGIEYRLFEERQERSAEFAAQVRAAKRAAVSYLNRVTWERATSGKKTVMRGVDGLPLRDEQGKIVYTYAPPSDRLAEKFLTALGSEDDPKLFKDPGKDQPQVVLLEQRLTDGQLEQLKQALIAELRTYEAGLQAPGAPQTLLPASIEAQVSPGESVGSDGAPRPEGTGHPGPTEGEGRE